MQADPQAWQGALWQCHGHLHSELWWWGSSVCASMSPGLLVFSCLGWFFPSFFPLLPFSSLLTDKQMEEGSVRSVFLKKSVLALMSGMQRYFTLATVNLEFHGRHMRKSFELFIYMFLIFLLLKSAEGERGSPEEDS